MRKINPIITLGLLVFFSTAAPALTFKADGSVVQSNGTVVRGPSTTEAEKSKTETILKNQQIVIETPDWCLNLPESNIALYKCGVGESKNLNMARNRATLDAKRGLADQIDSEISSRMEDFLEASGTGDNEEIKQRSEIVTKNVTVAAQMTGFKEVFSETQSIGSRFIHYVLIGYPVGQANQTLVNQIKADEVLSTTEAADDAIAELEAEIMKKYSGS